MKLLIYSDPHWSSYSSIVRSRGEKYSTRLSNLIDTLNWIEECAAQCDSVVCLGDFFDQSELNAESITALTEITWADKSHVFIVGNHEMVRSGPNVSSSHLFSLCPNAKVIDSPQSFMVGQTEICFLPYIYDWSSNSLKDIFTTNPAKRIVLSHNDIAGIQMGPIITKSGIDLSELEQSCDLFINGHLHNGTKIGKKLINLGNITGQNFGEDAYQFSHCAAIVDTESLSVTYLQNPFAMNFYQIDASQMDASGVVQTLHGLKSRAVVSIKTPLDPSEVNRYIRECPNIIASRVLYLPGKKESQCSVTELQMDHFSQFRDFVRENVGESDLILEELSLLLEAK